MWRVLLAAQSIHKVAVFGAERSVHALDGEFNRQSRDVDHALDWKAI
jgi:hypothetical protein